MPWFLQVPSPTRRCIVCTYVLVPLLVSVLQVVCSLHICARLSRSCKTFDFCIIPYAFAITQSSRDDIIFVPRCWAAPKKIPSKVEPGICVFCGKQPEELETRRHRHQCILFETCSGVGVYSVPSGSDWCDWCVRRLIKWIVAVLLPSVSTDQLGRGVN